MKTRLLSAVLLAVVATMIASAAFAAPVTPAATPFKGSWDSTETPTFVPAPPPDATIMFVDGKASGTSTLLGKYTATFKATVENGCSCSQGDTVEFTAANGDKLYGLGQGVGVPTDKPSLFRVTQAYRILSGTGRFAGATGNFVVIRVITQPSGVSTGSLDGTIVMPAGK